MIAASKNSAPQTVTTAVWIGFATMCLGMFMAILDVQVVATSLPTIQQALNIAQDQMSWIQTAYLIAEIISIPLTGFLTRLLTMRWLFVSAVSIFTLASIACAASENFSTLIAFRVLQGFSGGALIPAVFSAVFLLFPVRRQPLATMIGGSLAVLAPTVGPIVGGWITETYSWPWLFLINVLPGVVAASVASVTLPRARAAFGRLRYLDFVSLILGAVALAALEIAIKEAPERGWTSNHGYRPARRLPACCGRIHHSYVAVAASIGQYANIFRSGFLGRLCPQFRPWDRTFWFGLFDAGFFGVCESAQRA